MKYVITLIFILSWKLSLAQWALDNEVAFSDIGHSSIDVNGNLYLVNSLGSVSKFSKEGKLLFEYSAVNRSEVYKIISTTQFKTLLFYNDLQEYLVLDRYLSVPITYSLQDFEIRFAVDIAINYQQQIWVVDMGSYSLKLIDPNRNELLEEKSLAQILNQGTANISGLKCYHNRTYLIDEKAGVFIFDNIGNFMSRNTGLTGVDFEFYKDEMYYVEDGELVFKNIYSKQIRTISLPDESDNTSPVKVWVYDETVFVIGTSGFKIYKYLSAE